MYDFLLVFYSDLRSSWNRRRATSRHSQEIIFPKKQHQAAEQRHQPPNEQLSPDRDADYESSDRNQTIATLDTGNCLFYNCLLRSYADDQ